MRKASAFRRSWSYHLYRASVRESTGLLVRSPQLSLFHTESSPSSTAKNYDRVNSNDHRPPKSLIVRVDDSQATVPSIFGCKSYVSATGVSKPPESTTTAGSLDVFLPKTIPRLLRQDIYRPAFISGAHERASCTTGGLASAGNDAENCAKKFDCGQESYLDAKFQDTWSFYLKQGPYGRNCGEEFHQELQTQIRKVQGFLADFEDSDSRNPVQREKGYPKTGAVYWNWNGAPLGLGLSSSLTFPGISGRFSRRASICTAPSPSQRRCMVSSSLWSIIVVFVIDASRMPSRLVRKFCCSYHERLSQITCGCSRKITAKWEVKCCTLIYGCNWKVWFYGNREWVSLCLGWPVGREQGNLRMYVSPRSLFCLFIAFSSGVAPPTKSETTAEPLARDYRCVNSSLQTLVLQKTEFHGQCEPQESRELQDTFSTLMHLLFIH